MVSFLRKLSLAFAAGAVGGLVNSLALWLAGAYGVTAALHVRLAPHLTPAWLYPRVVWGGLWGLLLLLPLARSAVLARALIISLGPSIVQLFYLFPTHLQAGFMGLKLGSLTPLVVVVLNAVWGLAAVLWLRSTDRSL
jgi:hypothetical protein